MGRLIKIWSLSDDLKNYFQIGFSVRILIYLYFLVFGFFSLQSSDYVTFIDLNNFYLRVVSIFIFSIVEVIIIDILIKFNKSKIEEVLKYYWVNPLILFFIFFEPFSLFFISLSCFISFSIIKDRNLLIFTTFFPLLYFINPSLFLALPIYFTVLYTNRSFSRTKLFLSFFVVTAISLFVIFLDLFVLENNYLSDSIRDTLNINLVFGDIKVYIFILFILLSCYFIYSRFRVGIDSLIALVGILTFLQFNSSGDDLSFSEIAIFISYAMVSIGNKNKGSLLLMVILIPIYYIYNLFLGDLDFTYNVVTSEISLGSIFSKVFDTALLTSLIYFNLFILGSMIVRDDKFKFIKKPFFISIAGDSSTGKTTLTRNLASFFGYGSTLKISGDDYHKFERNHVAWKDNTHLDPKMNHLDKLSLDIKKLKILPRIFFCRG